MKKENVLEISRSLIKIMFGNVLLALAYAKWMVPHNIINGGVTSLSLVLQKVTQLPLPVLTNSLTVLLLIICGIFLGKASFMKSIVSSLSYMFFFTLFYSLPFSLSIALPIDFLLACFVIAFGYYCCLSEGSSTVGVDVIALVLYKKNPKRNLAKMIRHLNVLVLILGFVTYGWQAVAIGLIFSVVYAWFLEKFLALGEAWSFKAAKMIKND
ncbi:YitT family protein [Enterococcus sp. LJL98]